MGAMKQQAIKRQESAAGLDNAIDYADAVDIPRSTFDAIARHRPVAGETTAVGFTACSIREVDGVDHLVDLSLMERDGDLFFAATLRPLGIYQDGGPDNDVRRVLVPTSADLGSVFDAAAAEIECENELADVIQLAAVGKIAARFAPTITVLYV